MAATKIERVQLAEVKQGETKTVGEYTIRNRSPFTITVSEGSRGGYQYRVNGIPITQIMRFCGGELQAKFDSMRAVLSFMGLGECVADDTVGCQLSSGRRDKAGIRNPHHGKIEPLPTAVQGILKAIFAATENVAEKGKTLRRTGETVATTGKGKNAKKVEFNWRDGFATKLVATESGSVKVKAKKAK